MDLAEDVVQESFVKAYQKIHLFEERASFKSWLFRIAINTAQNSMRSKKSSNTVSIEKITVAVPAEAESGMVMEEIKEAIWEEVSKLPEKQRTALTLRVFEELSFKEIAQMMDCPYDTAKANYRHALMKLKSVFEDSDWLKNLKDGSADAVVKFKELFSEVDP